MTTPRDFPARLITDWVNFLTSEEIVDDEMFEVLSPNVPVWDELFTEGSVAIDREELVDTGEMILWRAGPIGTGGSLPKRLFRITLEIQSSPEYTGESLATFGVVFSLTNCFPQAVDPVQVIDMLAHMVYKSFYNELLIDEFVESFTAQCRSTREVVSLRHMPKRVVRA